MRISKCFSEHGLLHQIRLTFVTWFAGERMRYFASKDLLEPIDDIFENGFEADFPKAFVSASSYEDRIYFLPQSWYWWGVYYRKSVSKNWGSPYPNLEAISGRLRH